MIDLSLFTEERVFIFGLIFIRLVAFLFTSSFFGFNFFPTPVKVLTSVVLTTLVFTTGYLRPSATAHAAIESLLVSGVLEALYGIYLGFVTQLIFTAFRVMGELVSQASGLASAQILNPLSGTTSTVIEEFEMYIGILLFFILNGHHLFLMAVFKSFEVLPLGHFPSLASVDSLMHLFTESFFMGFKLASPVVFAIFMTNIAMGILGRAVPQMNVFMTSMQVTFGLAILILIFSIPLQMALSENFLQESADVFFKIIKTI